MSSSLDVEQLINEVKKRPILWKLSYKYKQKNVRQKAWAEVAKSFVPGFDEMSEDKKQNIYTHIQGKWRNLRDNYVRSMRRPDKHSQYAHSDSMAFLDPVYENRQNRGKKANADSNKEGDIQSVSSSEDSEASPSTIQKLKRKRQDSDKPVYLEMPIDNDDYQQASSSFQDEDRMFFESLLPAVKELDLDQKLEFRTQVLQLIKNFRNKTYVKSIEICPIEYED